jgi:hypothetical protein
MDEGDDEEEGENESRDRLVGRRSARWIWKLRGCE